MLGKYTEDWADHFFVKNLPIYLRDNLPRMCSTSYYPYASWERALYLHSPDKCFFVVYRIYSTPKAYLYIIIHFK